jgi:aminoglycoside phosphotransferase (APT) family kinase protein
MAQERPELASLPGGEDLSERLAAFLASQMGVPRSGVRIARLARLAGGASRELWAVDAELTRDGRAETLELVLRRDPPGRVGEGDRGLELRLLEAAAAAGLPVPRPFGGSVDPALVGSPFFLMERVAGETLPRRLLRDPEYAPARSRMTAQLGAALAGIHALPIDAADLDGLAAAGAASGRDAVLAVGAGLRELAAEPHPVLDLAERWLLERAPAPSRRVLVHGDYRVGNVIFDREGLRAVLDWELAHAGDPLEDLGWLCVKAWRFGRDELPVGGIGRREELIEAYEAAGGAAVDPAALRFWEAYGSFKLALVFVQQARVFLSGVPSVELASLGRRIAEAEDELVAHMEREGA